MEKKYDIFISYSRKDSAIVEQYYNYLIAAGLSVWLDKDGIETGDEFKRTIVRAIKNSEVFLFFSSANSNASPWTVKEVNVAVNCKKKIIPVKLDSTPYEESIMFDLAGLDFFDHANNGFEVGIEKLLAAFGENYNQVVEHINEERERNRIKEEQKQQEDLLRQQAAFEARKRIEEENQARIREEEYQKALAEVYRKEDPDKHGIEQELPELKENAFDYNNNKRNIAIILVVVSLGILSYFLFGGNKSSHNNEIIDSTSIVQADSGNIVQNSQNLQQGKNDAKAINKTSQNVTKAIKDNKRNENLNADGGDESTNQPEKEDAVTKRDDVNGAEVQPSFNGNINQYIATNIKYPTIAQEHGIQGRVIVSFTVERDGSISNVKVVKSVDISLDQEAVRVISSMPKWNPATKNGQPACANVLLPVSFRIR